MAFQRTADFYKKVGESTTLSYTSIKRHMNGGYTVVWRDNRGQLRTRLLNSYRAARTFYDTIIFTRGAL